jgi:hypothetical protein
MAFVKHRHTFNVRVIAPQELVFYSAGATVGYTYDPSHHAVGFTMPFVDGDFADINKLSNKNFRKSYGITTRDVGLIFLDGLPTLDKMIHGQGFTVGDMSDLNEIAQNHKMIFWDVDAWQFDKFPCPVATMVFGSVTIWNRSIRKTVFTQAMIGTRLLYFVQSLLVHPYD